MGFLEKFLSLVAPSKQGLSSGAQDITGREQAHELLKAAVESMPEGFLYFDADDRLAVVNSKIADIYPLAADVFVLGVSYETCMRAGVERGQWGPDADQDEEEWIQEKLDYHRNPEGATEYNLPDGRCIRVEEHRTPDGGVVGVRTDITELKRIERELRDARDELEHRVEERTKELSESEARFRAVTESSPAGITLKDTGGKFLLVNKTFARWMNAEPGDFEGKTLHELFPKEQADEIVALDRAAIESGQVTVNEGLRSFLDGITRTIITHKSPVRSADGEIVAVATVITDITERKMTEEALKRRTEALAEKVKEQSRAEEALRISESRVRLIMENIVEAVIAIGEDGAIETFNPAAEKMFGYPAQEILGENVSILADEPERSEHDQYIENYHRTGKGKIIDAGFREVRGRRKDGSIFPAELAINEIRGGRRRQFVGTLRDVTERKRAEKSLREAMERAEFANRAKTEFLAHMSHELRTPLNAILGYSDILKSQVFGPLGNEKYSDYVENIRAAGGHLLGILSDILDVSRVEAGELYIEDGEIDIAQAIKECKTMMLERADIAKVSLTSRVAGDLPRLRADGRRLRQILLNLVSNAVKFSHEKGEVSITAEMDPPGAIVIRIADTGIGIAPENMEKILRPFGQVKEAYVSKPGEGSGLGLSLVNSLMDLHGGTLDIDSTPGEGTTASITFPPERTLSNA